VITYGVLSRKWDEAPVSKGLPTDLCAWSFVVAQCAIPAAEPVADGPSVYVSLSGACDDLLNLFRGVSDGRSDQGRDHPVAAVLALSAAATVAGMQGYRAIAEWIADVPADVLADLYMRAGASPAPPPGKTTLWRVLTETDATALDAVIGTWLTTILMTSLNAETSADGESGLIHLRMDGKTVRGARDADGGQRHLLALLTGPNDRAVVTAQAEVDGAKTRETITARDLLKGLDLTGTALTADALHTVKATAKLIRERGGHFVLPVKENRGALFDALNALPWREVPIAHTSTEAGYGRTTTRTIQVLPAPDDLPFPHVSQVWLIERYVHASDGTPLSTVAQLGIASPDEHLATPADLARFNRDHWVWKSCTGSETPCIARTTPASAPAPAPASWPPCATSPSARYAWPDDRISPQPLVGRPAT
jgi:predicted transposase YbfD/YdcC